MGKKGRRRAAQGVKPQRRVGPTVVSSGDFAAVLRAEREAKERREVHAREAALLQEAGDGDTAMDKARDATEVRGGRGGRPAKAQGTRVQRNAILPLHEALNAPAGEEMRLGPNPRGLGIYNDRQRILVVGDGDFSFSLALASALDGRGITATSYDSRRCLKEKYPATAELYASDLRRLQAAVGYRVDGTALEQSSTVVERAPFDRIVFNFPHTGSPGSTKESVASNQELLTKFFASAQQFLSPRGEIHVTLRLTPFYERWEVTQCAEAAGLRLKRTAEFDATDYPGYECVRTASGELHRGAPSTDSSKTFCFIPVHPLLPGAAPPKQQEVVAHSTNARQVAPRKRIGKRGAREQLHVRKKRRKGVAV